MFSSEISPVSKIIFFLFKLSLESNIENDNEINASPAKQALIEIIKKFDNKLSIEEYYVPMFAYLENRTEFLIDISINQ